MPSMEPVHLMRWITDHPHFFRPPVANRDIETQLGAAIRAFNASETLRTCRACGAVLPVPAGA